MAISKFRDLVDAAIGINVIETKRAKQNTAKLRNGRGYGVLETSSAAPFQKGSDGWPRVLAFGATDPSELCFL